MENFLCIAEKAEQAKQIAIGLDLELEGYNAYVGNYKGNKITLVWCTGHLLEFVEPKDIKKRSFSWKEPKDNIPLPEVFKIPVAVKDQVDGDKDDRYKKRFQVIAEYIKKCSAVVCCTDPDDEGAVIFYRIIDFLGKTNLPLYHAILDKSLSKSDVCDAFNNLSEFDIRRYFKGLYRGYNDWTYMYLTAGLLAYMRAKFGDFKVASVGRVQTLILKLVDQQTIKHDSFSEYYYYLPVLNFQGSQTKKEISVFLKVAAGESEKYANEYYTRDELLPKILDSAKKGDLNFQMKGNQVSSNPNRICNLADLQRGIKGISADDVIKHADNLRLAGFSTYARTDHSKLPVSMRNEQTIRSLLKSAAHFKGMKDWASDLSSDESIQRILHKSSLWSDGGMEHHGIIITSDPLDPDKVDRQAIAVYQLILERMLLSFSSDLVYKKITFNVSVDNLDFQTSLKSLVDAGWTRWSNLSQEGYINNEELIAISEDQFQFVGCSIEKKKAGKPKLYTEGDLIGVLSKPYLVLNMSEEDRKIMKNYEGIGRPSTRSKIIEKLLEKKYLERHGNFLRSTELAKMILSNCPKELYNAGVTIKWIRDREEFMNYGPAESEKMFLKACNTQRFITEDMLSFWSSEISKLPVVKPTKKDSVFTGKNYKKKSKKKNFKIKL